MKKLLAILCLVLAMIMVCGVALASDTGNDEPTPTYGDEPNEGEEGGEEGDTMHEVNADGTAWIHVYPTDPAEGKVLTINGVKIIRFYCEKTDYPEGVEINDEKLDGATDFRDFRLYQMEHDFPKISDADFADYAKIVRSSCLEDGKVVVKCRFCDATEDVIELNEEDGHYYLHAAKCPATKEVPVDKALEKAQPDIYKAAKAHGHLWSDEDHTEEELAFYDIDDPDVLEKRYIVEKAPTCTDDGEVYRYCLACGIKEGPVVLPNKGHVLPDDDDENWKIVTPSTCTTKGLATNKCTVCGAEVTKELELDLSNHVWGAWQWEVKATCTEPGGQYRLCIECNKAKQTIEVPATGHDFEPDPDAIPATCCEEGLAHYVICKNCGLKLTPNSKDLGEYCIDAEIPFYSTNEEPFGVAQVGPAKFITLPIDPDNHIKEYWKLLEDDEEAVEPTCEEDGAKVYQCKCGVKITETVPALGHAPYTVYAKVLERDGDGEVISREIVKVASCVEDENGEQFEYQKAVICANETMVGEKTLAEAAKDKKFDITTVAEDDMVILEDWEDIETPAHKGGEWTMLNAPVLEEGPDRTPGYWINQCMVCGAHMEWVSDTAPEGYVMPEDPENPGTTDPEDPEDPENPGTTDPVEPELADAAYELGEVTYDGKFIHFSVEHVEGTKEAEALNIRVAFYLNDQSFVAFVLPGTMTQFQMQNNGSIVAYNVEVIDGTDANPETYTTYDAEFILVGNG